MALIYVSYVDAVGACFDAKYHYASWRPASAIQMADADGNDATAPDAARAPVLPTPDHPEYPAAHSCTSGSLGEALRAFYGTPEVTFTWDSTVTRTTRTCAGIDAFNAEARLARLHGGMHFRHAVVRRVAPQVGRLDHGQLRQRRAERAGAVGGHLQCTVGGGLDHLLARAELAVGEHLDVDAPARLVLTSLATRSAISTCGCARAVASARPVRQRAPRRP
jgi:hypothetical protein